MHAEMLNKVEPNLEMIPPIGTIDIASMNTTKSPKKTVTY